MKTILFPKGKSKGFYMVVFDRVSVAMPVCHLLQMPRSHNS